MTNTHLSDHRPRRNSLMAMRPAERERFLADVHVGIVAHGTSTPGAPLASPVWYTYEPGGDIVFVTSSGSLKASHLAALKTATFLVQDEDPPQRFVGVSGPVRVAEGASSAVRRTIARRHLSEHDVEGFLAMTPADALVTVSLTPTAWWSTDFGKLAATPLPS
jgi:nitroimidazol reductase NimA-like FMN-containing flavoprotein (pyridoxamine 5'-phosphate oxidase superfamily)